MGHAIESALRRLGIQAERRGRRWWARCPRANDPQHHAHGDQDASNWMMWSNEVPHKHGLHFCFACKLSGNLPQLVVLVLGLKDDFLSTAIHKAHEWLHGDVTRERPIFSAKFVANPARRQAFVLPEEVVVEPVDRWPTPMRRYILEDRGLTPEQVERWGIGYAVDGWLRGRIVVVTRDQDGVPVNYSARAIGSNPKRYLMADGRDGANKQVIFGEQHWRDVGAGTIVLTEGAFDALAVERVLPGVAVGALSGSHVNANVVARLAHFRRLVVATDPDAAGNIAAKKIVGSFARTRGVVRLTYPMGEDANSMDPAELLKLLRSTIGSEEVSGGAV